MQRLSFVVCQKPTNDTVAITAVITISITPPLSLSKPTPTKQGAAESIIKILAG